MAIRERIRKFFLLRGNIPALVANRLVDSTGWNMFETIWQPYALSLGASMPILGAFNSVYTGLYSVLQFGTGELSDSLGRKKISIISYALSIIGIVVALFAGSWEILIIHVVIAAVVDALMEPSIIPLFAESVGEDQRGTAFSLLSLTWFLPGLYSYLMAGFLAERYGDRLIVGILLATEIISFLIFALFVRETLKERKPVDLRRIFANMREILKPAGRLGAFYALAILDGLSWSLIGGIFVGMLWKSFGFSRIQIGVLLNAFAVATALSLLPMGKLIDRYGSRRPLILSLSLFSLVFLGYFLSRGFYGFLVVQAVKGLAVALWDPSSRSYLSNSVPEAERGKFFGCLAGLRGLVSFPAPVIGAFIFEAYGFRGAVSAGLLCSLAATAFSFKIRPLDKVFAQ